MEKQGPAARICCVNVARSPFRSSVGRRLYLPEPETKLARLGYGVLWIFLLGHVVIAASVLIRLIDYSIGDAIGTGAMAAIFASVLIGWGVGFVGLWRRGGVRRTMPVTLPGRAAAWLIVLVVALVSIELAILWPVESRPAGGYGWEVVFVVLLGVLVQLFVAVSALAVAQGEKSRFTLLTWMIPGFPAAMIATIFLGEIVFSH